MNINFQNLTDAAAIAIAISAIVAALTEVAKQVMTSLKEQRWLPVVPLALGVVIAFLVASDYSWQADVLGGLICGLGSMGLYSGAKAVVGK